MAMPRGEDSRLTKATVVNVAAFDERNSLGRKTEAATSIWRFEWCILLKDRCLIGVGTSGLISIVDDDIPDRNDDSDCFADYASFLDSVWVLGVDVIVGDDDLEFGTADDSG
jgi:hypothetical protein